MKRRMIDDEIQIYGESFKELWPNEWCDTVSFVRGCSIIDLDRRFQISNNNSNREIYAFKPLLPDNANGNQSRHFAIKAGKFKLYERKTIKTEDWDGTGFTKMKQLGEPQINLHVGWWCGKLLAGVDIEV